MKDKIIKIIKAILNKEKSIEFAYLFGSFISEKKHNDIDIGIYIYEGNKENSLNITSNLKHKISRKLKESNIHLEADEIDATLLNSINFTFMARILKEGVLILDKNPEHGALRRFRSYLEQNDILKQDFKNLKLFYINLYNLYKLGQFSNVIQLGKLMEDNILIISPRMKDEYEKILQIIGDSYQKIGSFFNAEEIYLKALNLNPENIVIFMKLEKIYSLLVKEDRLKEIRINLQELRMNREMTLNRKLKGNKKKTQIPLKMEGNEINLDVYFSLSYQYLNPLLSIFFNGNIVKEFYLENKNKVACLELDSKAGMNILEISVLNNEDVIVVEKLCISNKRYYPAN